MSKCLFDFLTVYPGRKWIMQFKSHCLLNYVLDEIVKSINKTVLTPLCWFY